MSDIFDETEENLRADKWVAIVKTALPWAAAILGSALVITLALWGWQTWQDNITAKASEVYQAGLDAQSKGDNVTAKAKYQDTVKSGSQTYKALALMQLGGIAVIDDNTAEAMKDFDEAGKASSSPIMKDLAAIKSAYLAMDTATYADMEKRLTPLTKDGRPYAALAKEALAMAKLQAGDLKGARSDLQVLSLTLGTPDGIKQRAGEFVLAIDSGAMPSAKAAMALPEAKAPELPPVQGPMAEQ